MADKVAAPDKRGGNAAAGTDSRKVKKARAEEVKELLQASDTPRAAKPHGSSFTALSWNVAGLRAVFNNGNASVLATLVESEQPDALVLLEHKLQAQHVAAEEAKLRTALGPAYGAFYWTVSVAKKGYSGVVVILRGPHHSEVDGVSAGGAGGGGAADWGGAGAPLAVHYGLGAAGDLHVGEGRVVTLDFHAFTLLAAYVPNSGEGLKRLEYRLGEWERDLRATAAAAARPLLLGGDLNVAHGDADIWNPTAAHIKKQAGLTPQERAAFGLLLTEGRLADTFRAIHPAAQHCYSYWSQRAGNRPFNRGLRLDYWLYPLEPASGQPTLVDAFICNAATAAVSDHAPVGVVLALH
jgi:exodeoxyribonuclease-3/AP endonuclease-1